MKNVVLPLVSVLSLAMMLTALRPSSVQPETAPLQHPDGQALQPYVVAHQGRLTVDLREAEVRQVLEHIAQQAGIPRIVGASSGARVSAQFANMPLAHGLRHLLQRAGLSHAMTYARSPDGGVILQEIWVFAENKAEIMQERRDASPYEAAQGEENEPHDGEPAMPSIAGPSSIGQEEGQEAGHQLQGLLSWLTQDHRETLPSMVPAEAFEPHSGELLDVEGTSTTVYPLPEAGGLLESGRESHQTWTFTDSR